MTDPQEPEEVSSPKTQESITLVPSQILASPLFSKDTWHTHIEYLSQYGDELVNDTQDRETFKSVGKNKTIEEIIVLCHNIHMLYESDLLHILQDLERPLDQLNDYSIAPTVTLDRLRSTLTELRSLENKSRDLVLNLTNFCHAENVAGSLVTGFLASIERNVLSAIIKYWMKSCREIIGNLEETIASTSLTIPNPIPRGPTSLNPTQICPPPINPPIPSPPVVPQLPQVNTSSTKPLAFELSKAKIPRFSGRKEEFPMFFALLNEVINYNREYPETALIAFVVSNLSGEPLNSIQSVPVRQGSLAIILKSLEDRYGDSDEQIHRLMKILKDKRLSVPRDHKELTAWYYQLRDLSACILKSASEAQESLFLSCLFDSLPYKIHEAIVATFDRSSLSPTVENVINELGVIVRTRDKLQFRAEDASDRREARNFFKSSNFDSRPFPLSQNAQSRDSCVFCSRNHRSEDCRTVSEVSQRQRVIRQKGLCLRCLRSNHSEAACRSPRCSCCQKNHHVSVCYQKFPSQNQSVSTANNSTSNRFSPNSSSFPDRSNQRSSFPNNSTNSARNPAQTHFPPIPVPPTQNSPTPAIQIRGVILDQYENLMSPKIFLDHHLDPIRAFIDTGSDATFVEYSLCARIRLPLGPVIPRTVVPVGGVKTVIETREVTVPLKSKNGPIVSFRALAVPDLHQFFTGTPSPPDKSPILFVFGQDSFSELEIEKTDQISPEGFRIMSSRFGEFAVSQNFLKTPEISPLFLHSNSQPRTLFNPANPDTRSFPQSRSDNPTFPNPNLTPAYCAFCSDPHDSATCQIVQDFDSRQRIVRENRLCPLCLQRGHIVAMCSHSCSNCNGRHHVSLCGKLFPPSESGTPVSPTPKPVIPIPNPALSLLPKSNPVQSSIPEVPMRSFRLNGPKEIPQLPSAIISHPIVSSSIALHPIVSQPIVSGSENSVISLVKSSSTPQDSPLNFGNPSDLVMVPHVCHRKWHRKKIVDRGQVLPLVNIGFTNLPQPHSPYDISSETLSSSPFRSGCNFLLNQLPMEQRTQCKFKLIDLELSHGQPFEDEHPDALMPCTCPDVPNPNPPATEEPKGCQPMVKERRGKWACWRLH
ncbi:unnamed protein product [Bursaphelenchus xylophilus]|nr:unnamed protein product [Bursaphelenchus xylophilus]CAG9080901.1 unnamed protein product [Bursaphelenchus xylophilus]